MPAFLAPIVAGIGRKALLIGAAVVAVLAVLFATYRRGREAERLEIQAEIGRVKNDQLEAALRRPADRRELARSLRDGSF